MGTFYSPNAGNTPQVTAINDNRRIFNFGDRIAELAPQQSPFFVYLAKVAKKATDDPVFKFLEQRHQWQRRNFEWAGGNEELSDTGTKAHGVALGADEDVIVTQKYDKYGNISSANNNVKSLVPGTVFAIVDDGNVVRRLKISENAIVVTDAARTYANWISGTDYTSTTEVVHHNEDTGLTTVSAEACTVVGDTMANDFSMTNGQKCQILGSAFGEGTTAPVGWEDSLYDREGYCQIFKTAMNLFSGTAMATGYRGIKNEYQRVWQEKLMEHKMDLEQAFLLGVGNAGASETSTTSAPVRYTHGIVPYTEANGKVYNMSYASSGYDAFLDAMEDFFAPEGGNSGNKLVLASRKVITYLNKLGSGSFLNNSVGASQYSLDVKAIPGAFGHQVTVVNTIFGNLHFVAEPLLRGPYENYCCAVDMKNVAYRPLMGNGISRDTFIETNIQANDEDGRRDQIITEAGLEISLPETHAVLKFS